MVPLRRGHVIQFVFRPRTHHSIFGSKPVFLHNFAEILWENGRMEQQTNMTFQDSPRFLRKWGFWAVVFGALALVLVFVQIVGPTLEPKPSAATQIGEIAGEIKRSAWRTFLGLPKPEPEVVPVSKWNYLAMAVPILGAIAIVLSVISGVLRENWRYPVYGTSLGVAAVVFHFFWWVALLVAGVILLVSIIENIGDIFSF